MLLTAIGKLKFVFVPVGSFVLTVKSFFVNVFKKVIVITFRFGTTVLVGYVLYPAGYRQLSYYYTTKKGDESRN